MVPTLAPLMVFVSLQVSTDSLFLSADSYIDIFINP